MKRYLFLLLTLPVIALPLAAAEMLTLDEALQSAVAANPTYLASVRSAEASENKQLLVRAGFMPIISSELSYKRTTLNSAGVPGASSFQDMLGMFNPSALNPAATMPKDRSESDSFNNYSLSLLVTQNIWDFKTYYNYQGAGYIRSAAELDADTAVNNLYLTVVQAYYAVLAADATLVSVRGSVAQMEKRFETAVAQVDNGLRTPVDKLRAEAELAAARLNLIKATNLRTNAVKALATAIGLDPANELEIDPAASVGDAGDDGAARAVATAIARRPDTRALKEKIAASRLTAKAARGDYYPQFKANAGVSYGGYEFDALKYNWYIGAAVSWNIFAGLATQTQAKDADAAVTILELNLRALEQSIRYEVETALTALKEARDKEAPTRTMYDAAKAALDLADQRFAQGLGTITDVSDAQAFYEQASAALIQTRYDLETAKAKLKKALGLGGTAFYQHKGE
ncbi:MAG TPA: TolC family protein [bacterium]|nr:TolC family protein [bacterium]